MHTTLAIDDDLLAAARDLTGLNDPSALVRAGLTALVERESARRLARLGGSQPGLKPAVRRRSGAAGDQGEDPIGSV
jgi:Arc/MetJ family transcription regulator